MPTQPSMQKLASTANAGLETFQSLADIVLNASEQLLALNVDAARSWCALASTHTLPANGEELREHFTKRIATHNQSFEQAAEYLRNVNEVCLRTQSDVAEISTRHLNQITSSMQSLFGEAAKLTPTTALDMLSAAAPSRTARKAA